MCHSVLRASGHAAILDSRVSAADPESIVRSSIAKRCYQLSPSRERPARGERAQSALGIHSDIKKIYN